MSQPEPAAPDVGEAFAEAYRNYSQALKDAWRPEEAQARIETAFVDYVRALLHARAPADVLKRFEAHLNYLRAVQEAWLPGEARQRLQEAYAAYVRALQAVRAQLNVSAFDVASLAALAHGTRAGACQASPTPPGGQPKSEQG